MAYRIAAVGNVTGEIRDLARIDAGRGEHVALEDLLPTLGKVDSNATCLTDVCGNNGGVQNRIRATRRGNVRELVDDLTKDLDRNETEDALLDGNDLARVPADSVRSVEQDG